MSKPTAPEPAKAPVKRGLAALPADLQAAGKIDQILTGLSIDDAEVVLERANRMFAKRKQLADKPAFTTEN